MHSMLPAVSGSSISSRSLMVMGRKSSAPLRRGTRRVVT